MIKKEGEDIEGIVEKYHGLVYKIAYTHTKSKHCADDVFQEVFVKLITNNPEFNDEKHRKAWLIRVTINQSKKMNAKAWHRKEFPMRQEIMININSEEKYIEDPIINRETVYNSVLKLPMKYRSVIHLFYYENMSINEISYALDIREGTIKSQLSRARKILKNYLKGDFDCD